MRVKKEFWLVLGIVGFVLWVVLISVAIVDLYVMQDYFIDAVYLLKDDINDITINPQVSPFLIPKQDTEDILGIELVSLSDETKELVDGLWWKHYGASITNNIISYDPLSHWSWTMSFNNGTLTIKTSDGTWFIEMQRKEE